MAIKRCFLLVCGFLSLTVLSAQGLPKMPVDPDLVHGTLPNGTSYYVMSNPSLSAHADFAIVSRTGRSTTPSPEQVERISREFLSSSRRIGNRTVQDFMLANGASYGKDGFVSVRENATIVRFSGVSTAKLDSVLLVIFDVIDKVSWSDDEFLCRWYAPSDQAVIICGDVDAPSVISKMRMLSMMTPAMESVGRPEYVMDQSDKPFLTVAPGASDKISEFTISWSLPRTPREYMNTVQPVVYEKFVSELGYLASSLIKRELRYKGIPYADVSWKYVAGVETESAELFSLSLAVGPEDMKKAVETAAKVLSCIDSGRISEDDYKVARQRYLVSLSEEETDPIRRNQEYFNRCLSSFLYGAHLFSDKDKLSFLSSKQMEQKAEVALFADVAAAIIDSSRNVTLSLNHPSGKASTEEMSDIFNAAWNDEEPLYLPQRKDSLVWNWPTPKVMLKSSRKDHLSGGQIWTFSNGFRVIYRKQPSSGRLYYSLALNGGFGSIKGLEKGEGAYFSEYLPLCRIGGMDGEQFVEHLLMEGMTLTQL